MALALSFALVSTALGTALGLLRAEGHQLVRGLQLLALLAALLVVFLELLPAALATVGPSAMVVFGAALLVPMLLRRLLRRSAGDPGEWLGLLLGYGGLLVHKLGDGVALAAFSGVGGSTGLHLDVLLAIGAHTVPVTAVVVMAFAERRGRASGVACAAGLAASMLLGIALTEAAPPAWLAAVEGWIEAVVAGLLLHVIGSEGRPQPGRTAAVPIEKRP